MRFLVFLTLLVFGATSALATTPPADCAAAFEAAQQAGKDWTDPAAGTGLVPLDGATLNTPAKLARALRDTSGQIRVIRKGVFRDWDFTRLGVPLQRICFEDSDLSGSDWHGVNASGSAFVSSNLTGARMHAARLDRVLLHTVTLEGTDMSGASLAGGRLSGSWDGSLVNWNVAQADLSRFAFDCGITVSDGCPLDKDGINMTGARLAGTDLASLPTWGAITFDGARIDGLVIAPRQLAEIGTATIAGPVVLVGGAARETLGAAEAQRLVAMLGAARDGADQPAFPCQRAASAVEKLICGEYETGLRKSDRTMAALYGKLRGSDPGAAAAQQRWLAQRNRCTDRDCLAAAYDQRIGALLGQLGDPQVLRPGQTAWYVSEEVAFPDEFRADPLFRRLVPVLGGAADFAVKLTRERNGTYTATGGSLGANAHMCSLGASGLRFDPATGWFAVRGVPLLRIVDQAMDVYAAGRPDESSPAGLDDLVSCGARASFGTMRLLPGAREGQVPVVDMGEN